MINRINQAWRDRWRREEHLQWEYGHLIQVDSGDGPSFVPVGRPTYLYVRMREAQTPMEARNDAGVPHIEGMAVRMKLEHGTYVIYGRSGRADLGVMDPSPPSGGYLHTLDSHSDVDVPAPGDNHYLFWNDAEQQWVADQIIIPQYLRDLDDVDPGVSVSTDALDFFVYSGGVWLGVPLTINPVGAVRLVKDIFITAPQEGQILRFVLADDQWQNVDLLLSTLMDVELTAPAEGDVIIWDATLGKWVNLPAAGGTPGADGIFGGDSVRYVYNDDTSDADPGGGSVKFNHATFGSVTQIYIDDQDIGAADVQAWIAVLDGSTNTIKGAIRIFREYDSLTFAIFHITSTVEATGYWKLNVIPVVNNGTFSPLGGEIVVLSFARAGDAGTPGATYTDEMAQDAVGGMFSGNVETDIAVTYQDATAKVDFVVSPTLVGDRIHAATTKATPVAADEWGFWDSVTGFLGKLSTTEMLAWLTGLFVDLTTAQSVGGVKTLTSGIVTPSIDGSIVADGDVTIQGTTHATRAASFVLLNPNGGLVGIFQSTPVSRLHVTETTKNLSVATFDVDADDQTIPRGFNIINRDTSANSALGIRFDFVDTAGSTARGGAFMIVKEQTYTPTGTTRDASFAIMTAQNGTLLERMRILSNGLVGISKVAPTARLDIVEGVLGAVAQRITSTATNDDPTQETTQQRIATTNATVTTLQTIPIPASFACQLECVVTARRTGGASGTAEDCAAYVVRGLFNQVAGAANIVGQSTTVIGESVAGYDVVFDVNGTDARLRVTGVTNTSITWHVTSRHWYLST